MAMGENVVEILTPRRYQQQVVPDASGGELLPLGKRSKDRGGSWVNSPVTKSGDRAKGGWRGT